MDDRLEFLTGLVQQQSQGSRQAVPSPNTTLHPRAGYTPRVIQSDEFHAASPRLMDTAGIREELSLTQKHCVAPQHLLTWPCSPLHLSEDQLHYPMELEINRQPMSRATGPPTSLAQRLPLSERTRWLTHLSMSQINLLTRCYFGHYHPSCLVLDEQLFYSNHVTEAMRSDFGESMDTCILLLVCALGSISAYNDGNLDWAQTQELDVGVGFFNIAREMFFKLERADWPSVQALLLMGLVSQSPA